MRALGIALVAAAIGAGSAGATASTQRTSVSPPPSPPPPSAAPAATAPDKAPKPPAAEPYTYDPSGRRDPFVNLIGTGTDGRVPSKKGDGPGSMAISDLSVRGVLQSGGALVAMVQGPDNKTYIVHQGDKLLDGAIKTITPQGIVFEQEVNDPLSVVKQREIRKFLRGFEDLK